MVRGCQRPQAEPCDAGDGVSRLHATPPMARVFWDVDGNEYLDFLLGFGPILLGYNDLAVNAALGKQITEGTIFSTAHPKELEVAQMLIDRIPVAEMVGFLIGGSSVTSAALRLARCIRAERKSFDAATTVGIPGRDRATPAYRQASPS